MPLTLLAGPANAGKVALLLDRYLADIGREPLLIVPNRADIDRVERDLLAKSGALLGGRIGTFDDVFEGIARSNGHHRPLVTDAQRSLLVRDVVARARLNALGRSARFAGFADALGSAVDRVGLDEARRDRRRAGRAGARVPRRARPARALGPRPRAPARRRT